MNSEETVAAYWARADELRQKYAAAGGNADSQSWMGKVIAGLPMNWETLKVVLNTQFAGLSEANLLMALTAEEARQSEQSTGAAMATYTGARGGRWKNRQDNQEKGKGPASKVLGKDGDWGKLGKAPPRHCHGCHKPNHDWRECRTRPPNAIPEFMKSRGKGQNQQQGQANSTDEASEDLGEIAVLEDASSETVTGEASVAGTKKREGFWMDSAASYIFTPDASDFRSPLQPPIVKGVRVGDGRILRCHGMGWVTVKGHQGRRVTLTMVHYVPELHTRLLSSLHLTAKGFRVVQEGTWCEVSKKGVVFMRGVKEQNQDHGLIRMDITIERPAGTSMAVIGETSPFPIPRDEGDAYAVTGLLGAVELAHKRLVHVAPSTLKRMVDKGAVTGIELGEKPEEMPRCEACLLGKIVRKPFPDASLTKISSPLDLVSLDMWGPVREPSYGGKASYVLSLIDHATSMLWCFPLLDKSSKTVRETLEQWRLKSERQAGTQLKILRMDNGTEFLGEVQQWMGNLGISRQRTAPYNPQQNGKMEQWHKDMADGIRTLLLDYRMPAAFWAEALRHVVWVKVRVVHSSLEGDLTPFEAWTGRKPDLAMARVWGSMGCVRLNAPDEHKGGKLGPRGVMCICLGVDEEAKAWRMLDPSLMRVRISPHVDFLEHVPWKQWQQGRTGGLLAVESPEAVLQLLPAPPLPGAEQEIDLIPLGNPRLALPAPQGPVTRAQARLQQAQQPLPLLPGVTPPAGIPEVQEEVQRNSSPEPSTSAGSHTSAQHQGSAALPRRSMRDLLMEQLHQRPNDGQDVSAALAEVFVTSAAFVALADEPLTAAEALSGPDKEKWHASIDKEMSSMEKFHVWDPQLVDLPPGKTAVDSKLIFKHKTNEQGEVVVYKTRLVARGFTQRPGEDFGETYSSVAKLVTVRLLMASAACHGWHVHTCDVDSAFLNAPLQEEIYLRQPDGFSDGTDRVFRLRKALYGLKQAPKMWNEELGGHLQASGFERSASDDALYIKFFDSGFCFIPAWVDDLLLVSDCEEHIQTVKEILGNKYKIKDLGEVSTYLGMQVKRDKETGWLELGLEKYVGKLEEKFSNLLQETSKVQTPMAPDVLYKIRNGGWSDEEAERVSIYEYLSLVGCLQYAATAARPDLAFTVSTLAQDSSDPRVIHMNAAARALRYLVDTAHFVLRFHRESGSELVGYTDSDWASEADAQSRAAYVFKVGGGAVSWASKKLEGVADSTTVAEYKALTQGAKEAIWLRQLCGELRQGTDPIPLRGSTSAAKEASKPMTLHCDNQSALKLAHNPILHQRTKHVKVAWHFIREAIKDGDVKVEFVRTALQDADILTKALDGAKHKNNRFRLGLVPKTGMKTGLASVLQGLLV